MRGSQHANWHGLVERSTVQNSCAMVDLFVVATCATVKNTRYSMGRAEEAEVARALAARAQSSCGTWTLPLPDT